MYNKLHKRIGQRKVRETRELIGVDGSDSRIDGCLNG